MNKTRPIYVYKSNNSWWWQCRIPFCQISDCGLGWKKTLADANEHLRSHGKIGFGR